MQKTLAKIQSLFISRHFDELVAARDRADAVDTSGMTLGEGERAEILAATGANSIEELVNGAKVVKRLKRSALIQVHNLLYYANRYGVMICTVPAWYTIGPLNGQWGPCIRFSGGPEILRKLGAKATYTGRDALYDYSQCQEEAPDWLSP